MKITLPGRTCHAAWQRRGQQYCQAGGGSGGTGSERRTSLPQKLASSRPPRAPKSNTSVSL